MMKKQILTGFAATALTIGFTAPTIADVTATAGFVSDYIYRGTELGDAGAYLSVDYEQSGFYAGAWAIMDGGTDADNEGASGTGLEVDYYFGYGMEFDNGINFNLGYTAYTYTYNAHYLNAFEDEVGGSFGYKGFAVSAYYGWDHNVNDKTYGNETYSYLYYDLSWSGDVFGAVIGRYENDPKDSATKTSYNYAEISASGEVATLDMTVTLGKKFTQEKDGMKDGNDTGTGYIVLDVSKTFSL